MNDLYSLAIRLSFSAPGLAVAVGLAARNFGQLKVAAEQATTAVDRSALALQRASTKATAAWAAMGRANTALARSNLGVGSARGDLALKQARLGSFGVGPFAAGTAGGMAAADMAIAQQRLVAAQSKQATALAGQASASARWNQAFAQRSAATTAHADAMATSSAALVAQARGEMGMGKIMRGAVLMTGGMMGLGMLKSAFGGAISLQQAMTGVKLATPGPGPSYEKLQDDFMTIATQTQFSVTDIAQMAGEAARGGLNNKVVLQTAMPMLARLAEVEYQTKGIAPLESIKAGVTIAHFFQSYPKNVKEAKSFNELINLAGRTQMLSSLTPDQLVHTLQYMAPARAALGLKPEEIMSFVALASNVGLTTGRGGSRLMRALSEIAPSMSRRGVLHNRLLQRIQTLGHGSFFDAHGQFLGIANELMLVNRAVYHGGPGGRPLTDKQRAQIFGPGGPFGSTGGQAMATLTTEGAKERFAQEGLGLGKHGVYRLPSLWGMQLKLNETTMGQWQTFHTTIQTIATAMATHLIPALNTVLKVMVAIAAGMLHVVQHHKKLAMIAAVFVTVATAILLGAGAISIMAGAWMLLNLSMAPAVALMLPWLAAILAITVAVTALCVVLTHLGDIGAWLQGYFGGLAQTFVALAQAFGLIKTPHGTHGKPYHVPTSVSTGAVWGARIMQLVTHGPAWMISHPVGIGGGAYGPGSGGHQIHIHVNGADHKTTQQLAEHVAGHVAKHVQSSVRYHAATGSPADLRPSLHGM